MGGFSTYIVIIWSKMEYLYWKSGEQLGGTGFQHYGRSDLVHETSPFLGRMLCPCVMYWVCMGELCCPLVVALIGLSVHRHWLECFMMLWVPSGHSRGQGYALIKHWPCEGCIFSANDPPCMKGSEEILCNSSLHTNILSLSLSLSLPPSLPLHRIIQHKIFFIVGALVVLAIIIIVVVAIVVVKTKKN